MPRLTAENIALRRTGITATDIVAIVGRGRRSSLEVWEEKLGIAPALDIPETVPQSMGHLAEPLAARLYTERTGEMVTPVTDTWATPGALIRLATPDYVENNPVGRRPRVVECKHRYHRSPDWGMSDTDQIPIEVAIQCQWQMDVGLGQMDPWIAETMSISAILGGQHEIYHLTYDEELCALLRESAFRFWYDHVLTRIPPPPNGSDSADQWIRRKYPQSNGTMMARTPELERLVGEWLCASEKAKEATIYANGLKQRIQLLIGDSDGIEGLVTYKSTRPSVHVDWEGLARSLGAREQDIEQWTSERKGSRQFRVKM